MVGKETSIAEKIIKNFLHGSIALNKKFNGKKPDIQFKDLNFIVSVYEGNHEDYNTDDEKKREDMFKRLNFKIIRCNPNGPAQINSFQAKKILTSQNCFACKDYLQNFRLEKVKVTNKVLRENSNCVVC